MEIALLIIAVLSLIPVGYLIYTRLIRKPHSIDFEIGNVALSRVASPNQKRDGKLALMIYALAFVNTGANPCTLKKVLLEYRFEGRKRKSEVITIPTGTVDGVEAIALANAKDQIIIAWTNLRETLSKSTRLQPGEVLKGSAVFLLDVPIPRLRDISDYAVVIRDYSGGHSMHKLKPEDRWYQGHEKGFSLMDAPVAKTGGKIHWQGITVTTQNPA